MGITTTTNQRAGGGFRLIKDSKSATTVTDPYGSDDIINASMRTAGYGSLDYQSALRQQEIKIFISYSPMAAVELNSLLRGYQPGYRFLISADNDYYSESNIDNKLISLYRWYFRIYFIHSCLRCLQALRKPKFSCSYGRYC